MHRKGMANEPGMGDNDRRVTEKAKKKCPSFCVQPHHPRATNKPIENNERRNIRACADGVLSQLQAVCTHRQQIQLQTE